MHAGRRAHGAGASRHAAAGGDRDQVDVAGAALSRLECALEILCAGSAALRGLTGAEAADVLVRLARGPVARSFDRGALGWRRLRCYQ